MSFSITINISNGEDAYIQVIQDLRTRLAAGRQYIESVGTLAPQVPPGGVLQFFDAILSYTAGSTTYTITLRLRSDNLYLVGWRRPTDNFWYELGHEGGAAAVITQPGTRLLALRESYIDLTRVADWRLEDIPLSAQRIEGAIRTLSTTAIAAATPLQPIARSVLIMTFTVAEATRLRSISDLVHRSWWSESTPGLHFASQVRSWSRLSNAVQRTRNQGFDWDFDGQTTEVWSFAGAILVLGIMHVVNIPPQGLNFASRSAHVDTHNVTAAPTAVSWAKGQPLLEVFYVRFKKFTGTTAGDLYGDVKVTNSVGTESLWSRSQANHVPITPGEDLTLEGPRRSLSAADEFVIDLNLRKYSSGDAVSLGTIQFAPFDYYTQYDVVKTSEVNGKNGSAEVSYMAISNGLYATITVILINGDNENPANVFGDITTNNGRGTSRLFHKTRLQHVDVVPQRAIPLSRTIVAVPITGSLVVNANLSDFDSSGPDHEIAAGSATFQPQYKQSTNQRISGRYGQIEVQVSWK